MFINPGKPAALIIALLSPLAEADVAAGVTAYQKHDFSSAIREFQAAAKRDEVRALNYLGIMYAEGVGTPHIDE